jgi:hypothetical protein
MSRFLCSVMVVVAGLALMAAPASAAPDEDFVVGSGRIVIPNPLFPGNTLTFDIVIDAHSDASGGNPSGIVTLRIVAGAPEFVFSGPVTCLVLSGNAAIIGWDDVTSGFPGHRIIDVVDNAATGALDVVAFAEIGTAACDVGSRGPDVTLVSGDFVVHDAVPLTSKDQCKDGGWRDFSDDQGQPFDNQGDCIAFVQHAT